MRRRNQAIEKMTLKERIETLKVLEQVDRRKRVKEKRERQVSLVNGDGGKIQW